MAHLVRIAKIFFYLLILSFSISCGVNNDDPTLEGLNYTQWEINLNSLWDDADSELTHAYARITQSPLTEDYLAQFPQEVRDELEGMLFGYIYVESINGMRMQWDFAYKIKNDVVTGTLTGRGTPISARFSISENGALALENLAEDAENVNFKVIGQANQIDFNSWQKPSKLERSTVFEFKYESAATPLWITPKHSLTLDAESFWYIGSSTESDDYEIIRLSMANERLNTLSGPRINGFSSSARILGIHQNTVLFPDYSKILQHDSDTGERIAEINPVPEVYQQGNIFQIDGLDVTNGKMWLVLETQYSSKDEVELIVCVDLETKQVDSVFNLTEFYAAQELDYWFIEDIVFRGETAQLLVYLGEQTQDILTLNLESNTIERQTTLDFYLYNPMLFVNGFWWSAASGTLSKLDPNSFQALENYQYQPKATQRNSITPIDLKFVNGKFQVLSSENMYSHSENNELLKQQILWREFRIEDKDLPTTQ